MAACMLCGTLALPGTVRASSSDDEDQPKHDARTEGYQAGQVEKNGTSLTWMLFVVLMVISLAALFKDAKRTHLD